MITEATGIGFRGELSVHTQEFVKFSEGKVDFSEWLMLAQQIQSPEISNSFQKQVEQRVNQYFRVNEGMNPGLRQY